MKDVRLLHLDTQLESFLTMRKGSLWLGNEKV
ncbi:hypothetical protein J2T13_000299 [Paenibacillus sp. DS2015]